MERVKSLKELADLGFTIGWRFYNPETARSYYKPPQHSQQGDGGDAAADGHANTDGEHSAPRPAALSRRSSAPSLLLVHSLSANCSDWISNGGHIARSGYFSEGEESPALHNVMDFT